MNQGSIFKARKLTSDRNVESQLGSPVSSESSFNLKPASMTPEAELNDNSEKRLASELTKNEKYCMSRLPALPAVFHRSPLSQSLINGYSDQESNFSLVLNEDAIHVWSYRSTDLVPLSIQFPIEDSSQMPLAILTKPSSGTSKDPGLVIIDSSNGLVKFYESVQHAPALGLINNKLLEITVPLNEKKGEYITLAENVEPAGIVIATSWKRCILISLRDFKSKPQLSFIELLNQRSVGSRLFSSFWTEDSLNTDEIVSIKSGKILNHGIAQEIIVQDSAGRFNFFTYHLSSANGSPYIEKKKSYWHDLSVQLKSSIEGYLPGSSLNVKFLDLWPLAQQENIYLGLCHVSETYKASDGENLLLLTIKIDATGVLLYGSHKLSRFDPNYVLSNNKPKLFLPKPGKTAFIVIDKSIIVTDINVSYIQSNTSYSYYRPRWEDKLRLKPSVEIIGYGYENQSANSNPAIILITRNFGVLRLERFIEEEGDDQDMVEVDDSTTPLYTVKSHIEQALFYSESQEIEFDINVNFSDDIIIEAILKVSLEILESSSAYLPPTMSTISYYLSLKANLYKKLIDYTWKNFADVYTSVLPNLLKNLEKNELGLNLWLQIEKESAHSVQLKELLETIIKQAHVMEFKESDNVLMKYFSQGLKSINQIFTAFTEQAVSGDFSLPVLSNIIVEATYKGVYLNEQQYISENPITIPSFKSWIFDTQMLIAIEDVFTKDYVQKATEISTKHRQSNLVKFVEVLYYFINNAIEYMSQSDATQLDDYLAWYKNRKFDWIQTLIEQSLTREGIIIVERYKDFSSLAHILETEKSNIIDRDGPNSVHVSELNLRYGYYFETFQYDFASALYDFYVKNDKIQALLLDFTNYKHFLLEYFERNPEKTSKFSWMRYLLDQEFASASRALIQSATLENTESLDNKQLKYSLAKLSIIAKSSHNPKADEEYVNECENNLIQIRAQRNLHSLIKDRTSTISFEFFVKHYVNGNISQKTSDALLKPSFTLFLSNIPLPLLELINYLTLVTNEQGFIEALKLVGTIENERLFKYYAKIIWLRLLTTTDDWPNLFQKIKSKVTTEEYINEKIHGSVLFKTFNEVKTYKPVIEQLDLLIQTNGKIDEEESEEFNETSALNASLSKKLSLYLTKYDFKTWIDSNRQEANFPNVA